MMRNIANRFGLSACLVAGVFLVLSCSVAGPSREADRSEELDRLLVESMVSKNAEAARVVLEMGANPEAILGELLIHHAVCAAIFDRSSRYLELLVEYGASPDAYWNVKDPRLLSIS